MALELRSCERYRTPVELIAEIDTLLDSHTDGEVAAILNERGRQPLRGGTFSAQRVQCVRRSYDLKSRYERLRGRGLLDLNEMAQRLGVSPGIVKKWRDRGRLVAHVGNDKGECLYEWLDESPKPYTRHAKAATGCPPPADAANRSKEVQYAV